MCNDHREDVLIQVDKWHRTSSLYHNMQLLLALFTLLLIVYASKCTTSQVCMAEVCTDQPDRSELRNSRSMFTT